MALGSVPSVELLAWVPIPPALELESELALGLISRLGVVKSLVVQRSQALRLLEPSGLEPRVVP